ncbi:hypothetical protein NC651_019241 [Populus alba x Populus x berolinensis]|nr:hypothetical protein NC651_019241 [Populus alba x Populus x berolinensis]
MEAEEAQSSRQFQAPRPPDEQESMDDIHWEDTDMVEGDAVTKETGVGNSRFCSIDDLKRVNKFNILALTDPVICGRSGGIWILWRVSLKIIKSSRHLIHAQIDDGGGREKVLWCQKSWCLWIAHGDRNTSYFHAKTLIRRQKNKIHCLKDANNNWLWEEDKLKQMAIEYYRKLFTREESSAS